MRYRQIQLILIISMMIFVLFADKPLSVKADEEGRTRLTEDQDRTLKSSFYNIYGNKIKQQPIFRSDGEFEWKWMLKNAWPDKPITNGQGVIYYKDFNGLINETNDQGKHIWMADSGNSSDIEVGSNGNIYTYNLSSDSIFHETDKNITQAETGIIYINDRFGKSLLKTNFIKPTDVINMPSGIINKQKLLDGNDNLIILQQEGIVLYNAKGEKIWTFKDFISNTEDGLGGIETNVTDIWGTKGTVFFLTSVGDCVAIDSSGQMLWHEKVIETTFSVKNDKYGELPAKVLQTGDGQYIWSEEGKISSDKLNQILTSQLDQVNKPIEALWSGGSYSSGEKNEVIAKNHEGSVKWTYFTPDPQYGWTQDVICDSNGNVFFADTGGNVYGLDANGDEKFRLIRNNKDFTSMELSLTPEGELIGITEDIGMFAIGKSGIGITVEGERIKFDNQPIIQNGTTFVPFRPIFEKLGLQVEWNAATQTVMGTKNGMSIKLQIGSSNSTINGEEKVLSAPQIINGATYVPLRFVGESMGLEVEWDSIDGEVRVGSDEQLAQEAVERFLLHLQQGDDAKASGDISEKNMSIMDKAPVLATYFQKSYWNSDIQSFQAEHKSVDTILVKTVQHNQKILRHYADTTDKTEDNWYLVKRMPNGQWKIQDSDLFH